MYHLSVCVMANGKSSERVGVVVSAASEAEAVKVAETMPHRIGYCGNASFGEATTRALMMQNNTPGAWGPM